MKTECKRQENNPFYAFREQKSQGYHRLFCMEFIMCQASNKNTTLKVIVPFEKPQISQLSSQIQVC